MILKFRTGSHLYGLNTPESDMDYIGVFLPNLETLFGLEKSKVLNKSTNKSTKNTKDDVDLTLYEFRKFITLALQNNPNIIELLFANSENIIKRNSYGNVILRHNYLFPHKGLLNRFLGYSGSQRKKMEIKKIHYKELEDGLEYLTQQENIYLFDLEHPFEEQDNHVKIGDLKFLKQTKVNKVKKSISHRLANFTHRKDLYFKYGYDTKFASHAVRLLYEGLELLLTGNIKFPLQYPEIMEIKQGKWEMGQIMELITNLENKIKLCKPVIPNKPRFHEVQELVINILQAWADTFKEEF